MCVAYCRAFVAGLVDPIDDDPSEAPKLEVPEGAPNVEEASMKEAPKEAEAQAEAPKEASEAEEAEDKSERRAS